jgi:hypothetical protein
MKFYDLSKAEREKLVRKIHNDILDDLKSGKLDHFRKYFSDEDTYIRKAAYQSAGKIFTVESDLQKTINASLEQLFKEENPHIRQTVINSAGEIGIIYFSKIKHLLEQGFSDPHHSVRNAVIGSLKKICAKNPKETIPFIKSQLHHSDPEIRREMCHGLELRGRTHPQDVLPVLKELQDEKVARVRNMLIHVIGQISYKKGCLEKVLEDITKWKNKEIVKKSLDEILEVQERYKNFSFLSSKETKALIKKYF